MFVQVIEGRVQDAAALRAAIDDWFQQVAPGATGWLGSTGGVTEDGRAIALVRFESEQAARENSDRPEQDSGGRRRRSCSTESRRSARAAMSLPTSSATRTAQASSR